jgi:hypothetical protein
MGLLYGRAGRLTAENGGFRRGQVNQKWGTERTPPEVVMTFPVKRRSLFRAVNAVNNECDPGMLTQGPRGGQGGPARPPRPRDDMAFLPTSH